MAFTTFAKIRKTACDSAATAAVGSIVLAGAGFAPGAMAEPYRNEIRNDMSRCTAGSAKPAIMVTVDGVKTSKGTMRIQSYRATQDEWLKRGQYLDRIEVPAKAGTMTFCMPLPGPGKYAIAVRHDVNDNDKTDLTIDGGAMSNNPSLNIFNLGKPSYTKVSVPVSGGVKSIRIQMKYMSG